VSARGAYRRLASSAESALLPDLFERLVHVSVVEVAMGPLQSILTDLSADGRVDVTKSRRRYRSGSNFDAYLGLLTELGYAAKEEGLLVPGPAFRAAREQRSEEYAAVHWMMGDILRQRGTYMREVLHWNMMLPYLRWTNAYYWRALEANSLPLMSLKGLQESYSGIYGTPTHGHPTTQVMRLANAQVFHRQSQGQYEGDPEIFGPYSQRASERPEIAEALGLIAS